MFRAIKRSRGQIQASFCQGYSIHRPIGGLVVPSDCMESDRETWGHTLCQLRSFRPREHRPNRELAAVHLLGDVTILQVFVASQYQDLAVQGIQRRHRLKDDLL